jgi:hypothetical protein
MGIVFNKIQTGGKYINTVDKRKLVSQLPRTNHLTLENQKFLESLGFKVKIN